MNWGGGGENAVPAFNSKGEGSVWRQNVEAELGLT